MEQTELHTEELITHLHSDILCYNDKWAFVHIPKNAGSSFKDCYKPWAPRMELSKRELWAHQPPEYFIKLKPELAQLQWVGIVRNPYARLVSWFFFMQERRKQGRTSMEWGDMTFDYWIKTDQLSNTHKTEKYKNLNANGLTWKPIWEQTKWTSNVQVFRCEDQLSELEDVVGFKFAHHYNVNKTMKGERWREYYTPELIEIVYNKYKKDFVQFDYSKY